MTKFVGEGALRRCDALLALTMAVTMVVGCAQVDAEAETGDDCLDGQCISQADSQEIVAATGNATSCTQPSDCPSGFCVDGVCCDSACTTLCQACTAVKKGSGADGVCGFITPGTDPDNECLFGHCDGPSGCTKGGILLGNGSACTTASLCSSGSCVDGVCCNSACTSTCQACTAAKKGSGSDGTCGNIAAAMDPDNECVSGNCNGLGGCGTGGGLAPNGAACAAAGACTSGSCVDGVCCDSACTGTCRACTAAKKGSGADGICGTIAAATDPDNECSIGNCNGLGSCGGTVLLGNGAACSGAAQCSSGFCVDEVCCNAACTETCMACTVEKKDTGADGTCGAIANVTDPDNECVNGHCNGAGACVSGSVHSDGTPCSSGVTCASGFCVAGICCNTACSGLCEACDALTKGEESDGTCGSVLDGTDPDNECTTVCNGLGVCLGNTNPASLGTACVADAQCISGFCVDGVCCDNACTASCNACNVPGQIGTCSETSPGSCSGQCGGEIGLPNPAYVEGGQTAVGDMNGDGLDDLLVRSNNGAAIYLARGSGSFEPGAWYAHYPSHGTTVAADVDNDGDRDLVVVGGDRDLIVTGGAGYLYIVKNLGNGTLTEKITIPLNDWSTAVETADFNGDGFVDIVTLQYGGFTTVHLNQGNGNYAPAVYYPGFSGLKVKAADMDGDGDRDLVLLSDKGFRILMNQGNGSFVVGTTTMAAGPLVADYYTDLGTVDVDADGDTDIVITDRRHFGVWVKLNPGNGQYPALMPDVGEDHTPFEYNYDLEVADFNGDGLVDYLSPLGDERNVYLLLGGTSTWQEIFVGDSPNAVHAGDFDGDGDKDAAVMLGSNRDIKILLNNGSASVFPPDVGTTLDFGPSGTKGVMTATDANSDGQMDIVNTRSDGISVRTGLGNGTFLPAVDYPTATGSSNVVAGDVNGDGKPDLAVAHGNSKVVSILMNQGNGTYAPKVDYTAGLSPRSMVLDDVNGDNKRDLVVGNSGTVTVQMNQGPGTFGNAVTYTIGSNSTVAVVDFNGDGWNDILVAPSAENAFSVGTLINQGNGTFVRGADIVVLERPNRHLTQSDFDGDGRVDVVVGLEIIDELALLHNNGNGTFTQHVLASESESYTRVFSLAAGDMNRDGLPDIITVRQSSGVASSIQVLVNEGNGTSFEINKYAIFTWLERVSSSMGPSSTVAADFNADGTLDFAYSARGKAYLHFNTCIP